ncbi:MAG: response regulator transcription factor [Acidobacteriota bacterium]|nr:response regulator transcription factor [Acidobacteriota bacterium]MDE3107425.1 response regulator transcription factor [Acidobacteriota bacterium]
MSKILIIDDEPGVRDLLDDALSAAGYETQWAANGAEGLDHVRRSSPDLCIVDINMPVMNGYEFLEKLRAHDERTPVLMLSARDGNEDVERGLRFGADDYVRKPFSLEELLLRVAAILRRAHADADGDELVLACGPLTMNIDRHEVYVEAELVELSATEFRLLEVLLENRERVVTREHLLRDVWNIDFDSDTSVLDTYVSYLRRKIHRDAYAPITTVRGVGFKLVAPTP